LTRHRSPPYAGDIVSTAEDAAMPLLDHFHPPLSNDSSWESFHSNWATKLADSLNSVLPSEYRVEEHVHFGPSVEIDVATFERSSSAPPSSRRHTAPLSTPTVYAPPAPTHSTPGIFLDTFEVLLFRTRAGKTLVAGIVDITAYVNAGPQWVGYMSVADVDKTVAQVRSDGGKVLVEPRNLPNARAAVVADPQGAPLGLAQVRGNIPEPADPAPSQFFWNEYLARDAAKALDFYKRLAGYEATISESRLGVDYHILRKTRARAGLFQLPASATGVEPNWLPYVLVNDPAALAARVGGLGGRILLPAAPERRNGSVVVIADPGGAPLALQKFPF
jgi:predicted enzyme related to lactoylglutathione lyase